MLQKLMESHSPCLSTKITELMVKNGLSDVAARQRISRGFDGMARLTYLSFSKKAKFVYLRKDYGSPKYWTSLEKAILESDSSYSNALAAVIQRNGIMLESHFLISCGAPIRQKKQVSADEVLKRFKESSILHDVDVSGVGKCVMLSLSFGRAEPDINRLRARLVTEAILLDAVKMWARRLNLVSYNRVAIRHGDNFPRVGTFAWDFTAPSYLYPLMKRDGKQAMPGFVVCDILLGSEIQEKGIQPFLAKCRTSRSFGKIAPSLQIFIADRYSDSAFKNAKSAGIIPSTPETLFGMEVAQGLNQLMGVLTQTAIACSDPETLSKLFEQLGQIEGAAIHLRGALFEFVVAELVKQTIGADVRMNKIYTTDQGDKAEVDVLAVQHKRAINFIECKGYNPLYPIPDAEVKEWLTVRIPRLWAVSQRHPDWKSTPVNFELWTTGKLSDDSVKMLKKAASATKKYIINYLDADAVRAYAKKTKDKRVIDLVNEHFLKKV